MKIKILHLYHDLMNLYGEYANVSVLCRHLEEAGMEVVLDKKSIGDRFSLTDYDFIYCGAGTERNQKVALADFINHKDELKLYSENKPALFTGNSLEMLGNSIVDKFGVKHEGLGLTDFNATEGEKRLVGDAVFTADFTDKLLVGFINKCSSIDGVNTPLLNVKYGIGNKPEEKTDGVRINNILGTYLTGPVLVKNPKFLSYVIYLITGVEVGDKLDSKSETEGYNVTVNELMKRFS